LRREARAGVLVGVLVLAACDGASGPSPTTSLPATVRTIEASTQMHLAGVDVGVGNIQEETYTDADGVAQTGLTAGLFVTVEQDATLNHTVRVHPGQDIDVPGYRLHVIAVEPTRILLDVIEVTD
jgi:hypothetical protein